MKKLAVNAALSFALGSGALADGISESCYQPLSLIGINANAEETILHFYDNDNVNYEVIIEDHLIRDGVLTLEEMNENGLLSNGMSDFIGSRVIPSMNEVEMHLSNIPSYVSSYSIFVYQNGSEYSNGVQDMEGLSKAYDVQSDYDDFETFYNNGRIITEMALANATSILGDALQSYNSISQTCTIADAAIDDLKPNTP